MNNFILNYNPLAQFPSEGQILTLVRINRHVVQFYQPFAGTYLLRSYDDKSTVNGSFKGIFENTPYILTQVHADNMAGALPQEIWQWVNHGTVPAIPGVIPPPPPPRGIGTAAINALGKTKPIWPPQ